MTDITREAVERLAHDIRYGEDNSRDYTADVLLALVDEGYKLRDRAEQAERERDEALEALHILIETVVTAWPPLASSSMILRARAMLAKHGSR